VNGSSKLIYGCEVAKFYLGGAGGGRNVISFNITSEEMVAYFPPHFRSILLQDFGFFRYECTFLYTRESYRT